MLQRLSVLFVVLVHAAAWLRAFGVAVLSDPLDAWLSRRAFDKGYEAPNQPAPHWLASAPMLLSYLDGQRARERDDEEFRQHQRLMKYLPAMLLSTYRNGEDIVFLNHQFHTHNCDALIIGPSGKPCSLGPVATLNERICRDVIEQLSSGHKLGFAR
ncbi:hypothetical protein [Chitinilyticum aquatile]|uniref:hypothetical protein n=1 Tax=Chitinilyticum aquatile TaxID=362520 RepID=UPI0004075ED9|nr:hypothetical protein [Chitinilyticum aquatile]